MSRQFDVYDNPDLETRRQAPFVIILQSHLWHRLDTTIVAPIFKQASYPPDDLIVLSGELHGVAVSIDVSLMANVETRLLRQRAGSLDHMHFAFKAALDRLFTGF